MKAIVKQQYQEFVENIEFPTLVYIYETGRIIAANLAAKDIIGQTYKNMNFLWENQEKYKLKKEVLNNGNEILFNQFINNGKSTVEIDIEISSFIVDKVHIIFCFFDQAYKQLHFKFFSDYVPRIVWKDKKLAFLGSSSYFKKDLEIHSELENCTNDIIYEKETSNTITIEEERIIKLKECQYNVIQQFIGRSGKSYFAKLNRMPIINKNGTCIGMLGVYTLILNRDAYKKMFDITLRINYVLNKAAACTNKYAISWFFEEGNPLAYVSANFSRLGYNLNDFYSKELQWKDIVYPEDYKKINFDILKENEIIEYRIFKKDGEIVWVKDETMAIYKRDKYIYREAILTDITVQKNQTIRTMSIESANPINFDAYKDFLTGLPNRLQYESEVNMEINKTIEHNKKGYVILFDLDDFKNINDGLGHEYGDCLLKSIAKYLIKIPEIANHCYRFGGDEFLIILSDEYEDKIDKLLKQLFATFRKPWKISGKEYYCTMSMGVTVFPNDSSNPNELIRFADLALLEAKRSGKNKISYYKDSVPDKSIERINLEKYLRKAIKKGCLEFAVYYQPIVSSKDKAIKGAEALLRWKSSELGFINPVDFIPLSEYLGLIVPLGEFVLREAFLMCKYCNEKIDKNFTLNINLSVVQLIQPNIVERIMEIARQIQVNCSNIVFEVTESLAIEDMELMKSVLNQLKNNGFKIALDDFGTGYSSLNHIMEIPLDYIKVDKSFISNYGTKQFNPILLSAITELAHSMNVEVVVEGVETKQQMEFLMFLDTDKYQGYLYGHPAPKDEFLEQCRDRM
jgi:diguanylate cyclase (GGDEF) domain